MRSTSPYPDLCKRNGDARRRSVGTGRRPIQTGSHPPISPDHAVAENKTGSSANESLANPHKLRRARSKNFADEAAEFALASDRHVAVVCRLVMLAAFRECNLKFQSIFRLPPVCARFQRERQASVQMKSGSACRYAAAFRPESPITRRCSSRGRGVDERKTVSRESHHGLTLPYHLPSCHTTCHTLSDQV